jgi:hypothetical protein
MAGANWRTRWRRRAGLGTAAFRSPLLAIAAAVALLVQLAVVPYHQALSAPLAAPAAVDIAAIAAELRATFGDAAALCIQTDGKGAPLAPAGDCDDHCPLCQFSTQSAALIAPDGPALPERLDAACLTLGAAPQVGGLAACPFLKNRARGPPFAV